MVLKETIGIFPKSVVARAILISLILVLVSIPASSKFGSYRYLFSWSMYNGAWVHETYQLTLIDAHTVVTISRKDLILKYNFSPLPYGKDSLREICGKDNRIKQVKRLNVFQDKLECL